jgi:hypothetical protein
LAKKKQPKKSLLGSLKNLLGGPPSDARYAKSFAKSRKRAKSSGPRRDLLAPFQLPILDLDLLVHPAKDSKPRIPPKLNIGTLLVSQRHGVKCSRRGGRITRRNALRRRRRPRRPALRYQCPNLKGPT